MSVSGRLHRSHAAWTSHPDALYGRIQLPPAIQRLLGTPPVKRLGRLRQLADIALSVPAATHTRLLHSLGVMHIAGAIFDRLVQKEMTQPKAWAARGLPSLIPAVDLGVGVQVAGLLHDVGHGPFSHLFETVLLRRGSGLAASHEKRTTGIIVGDAAIATALGSLRNRYCEPRTIAALTRGLPPPQHGTWGFAGQIVDGDLDADRLDFLRRDEHYTGRSLGAPDPWVIIDQLTLACDADGSVGLALPAHAEELARRLLNARANAYASLYNSPEALATHELLLLAFDERYPEGITEEAASELALETDDGLLARLVSTREGMAPVTPVARDVVRRLHDDCPYVVLPVKLGSEIVPLAELAHQTIARWRRPVTWSDSEDHRDAVTAVARRCLPVEEPGRVLLVLEESKHHRRRPPTTPWIVDGPTATARAITGLDQIDATSGQVSLSMPPEVLVRSGLEGEMRDASSWPAALDIARGAVRGARIAEIYQAWNERLRQRPLSDVVLSKIEEETSVWLGEALWAQ